MDRILQSELLGRYSRHLVKDSRYAINMFGIECGDGWFKLLSDLFNWIDDFLEQHANEIVSVGVSQIKEKYGELRFYVHLEMNEELPEDDNQAISAEFFEMIDASESISSQICERCGRGYNERDEPSKLWSNNDWLKTLCDICADRFGYAELA